MMISGVSTAQGRTYVANNGKDAGKVEDEIKRLEQKIKEVENSFDSPNAKKIKKQELESQVQKKRQILYPGHNIEKISLRN